MGERSNRVDQAVKIQARRVERSFQSRGARLPALGPLDLDVAQGEFLCVIGPSGCGKTTLLRVMAGLINPTGGCIEIRPAAPGYTPVAMVFQDYSLYPWKTVEANVRLGLDLAGVPRGESNRRVGQWLARLGLADTAQRYPRELSGGMRQRVCIARALVVEPEILLMDEPFAALDAQLRVVLQDELLRLWQADRRTVVFVTHSISEALVLGDRVIVTTARPATVLAEYNVPFARPRLAELRTTTPFVTLEAEIWRLLRDQVETTPRTTDEIP